MAAALDRTDLTPAVGSVVHGVKLTDIDAPIAEAISKLVAERGVLVFRDQPMTPDEQCQLGRSLGELADDSGQLREDGLPTAVKVVHVDKDSQFAVGDGWHSDRPVVERPPALSMLRIETVPSVGGDTAYASMYAAFETLSDDMQEFLLGKTAIFTGDRYRSRLGGGKAQIEVQEHPVVRTHPVTGRRALYVSRLFTKAIKELPANESDAILQFLYAHIDRGVSFQARVKWKPDTVALWDNRCVQHHAIWDYYPETRHGYRVTTIGEVPYL